MSPQPATVLDAGCGEGRMSCLLARTLKTSVKARDIGKEMIRENQQRCDTDVDYQCRSIYDLDPEIDDANLVVCCEVLEHLEQPDKALQTLHEMTAKRYIFSVPNEPWWRILNMARGAYWDHFGNTPGHIQHWNKRSFRELLRQNKFSILEFSYPLPWLVVLAEKIPR